MKKIIAFALVAVFAVFPVMAQSPLTSWEGVYRVNGVNMNTSYSGAVQIEYRAPGSDLYDLTWMLDTLPGRIDTTAIGYEHDGFLIVIGINTPMLASFNEHGQGLWIAPHATTPQRENLTMTHYEKLIDALRPPKDLIRPSDLSADQIKV